MTLTGKQSAGHLSDLVKVENDVAEILEEMSYELEHLECFDREQRAELHTILRAIQADTRTHHDIVSSLAGDQNGEYIRNA